MNTWTSTEAPRARQSPPADPQPIRHDLVARVRAELADGSFEARCDLDRAAGRALRDLR